jgi:hypothetical protein
MNAHALLDRYSDYLLSSFGSVAYLKLEGWKLPLHTNHFAFQAKLYTRALLSAFEILRTDYPLLLWLCNVSFLY